MSTASLTSLAPRKKLVATCPACQTRYKITVAMSGRKASCAKCHTRMRIPTLRAKINEVATSARRRIVSALPGAPSPGLAQVQEVGASSTANINYVSSIPGMRASGLGLLLCAWGTIIVIAILAAAVTMNFVAPIQLQEIRYYLAGGFAGGTLMSLIGLLVCGFVPRQTRARGWANSAIFFCILGLAAAGYAVFCAIEEIEMIVPLIAAQLTVGGLAMLAFFCFMCFAKNTARATSRPELSATARGVMWIQLLILAVVGGTFALSYSLPATEGTALLINSLAIGILVVSVINQVIAIVLQFQLGSYLRRRPEHAFGM